MRTDTDVLTAASHDADLLVGRLRAAGCVFAEDEAAVLRRSADNGRDLEAMCERRVSGEPLEHVVGWVDFGRLRFTVGPGVFVPRQRSRLIAQVAVDAVRSSESAVFAETFAGVAPVAATVARAVRRARVHAVDVDGTAVEYARVNLGDAGDVHEGECLAALPQRLRGRVDVIAAVPPYAPTSAADLLSRESQYEPPAALFGGSDGLDHVRRLIEEAPPWLAPGGSLLIEMNKQQCCAAMPHAKRADFVVTQHIGDDGQTAVLILRRRRR